MSQQTIPTLLEHMNSKFDLLIETVAQIKQEVKETAKQGDLQEVKADVKVVKAAVSDVSRQVTEHEKQIVRLKAA